VALAITPSRRLSSGVHAPGNLISVILLIFINRFMRKKEAKEMSYSE